MHLYCVLACAEVLIWAAQSTMTTQKTREHTVAIAYKLGDLPQQCKLRVRLYGDACTFGSFLFF